MLNDAAAIINNNFYWNNYQFDIHTDVWTLADSKVTKEKTGMVL